MSASIRISDYLAEDWVPALGCTEPASIAYAASLAASQAAGEVRAVHLRCDPRMYKNCYAVGIPHSEHKTGILWATAIGCLLPDPKLKLECFKQTDSVMLAEAARLLKLGCITVEADKSKNELFVDCRVVKTEGVGRCVIGRRHTEVILLEKNGVSVPLSNEANGQLSESVIPALAHLSFSELIALAQSLAEPERLRLREGMKMNLEISQHGLSLFQDQFSDLTRQDPFTRVSQLVFSGVNARMSGEAHAVMSLAGSGNKGITCAVPLSLLGHELKISEERIEEALALACLVTSMTTLQLGTLSAICGCSNAAGIGLAAGLVFLQGGGEKELSLAINNMVGNISGMICDGAKIGCALKAMTAVDSAFRAASLAMKGIGIPVSDGIVGKTGADSLRNLGRIATQGMSNMDHEILNIMQEKLYRS